MKVLLILYVISWAVEYFSKNYIKNSPEEKLAYATNILTVARIYKFNQYTYK